MHLILTSRRVLYFGFLLQLLLILNYRATAQTNSPKALADGVVPAPFLRSFLPGDGEVVSFLITSNVWPRNQADGPFFQNEMAEIAIGRGIRAKLKDRDQEVSLSPGVVFDDGFITIQGGWRLHKKVRFHPDFLDGCWNANVMIAYAGGQMYSEVSADLSWNISFIGRVAFPVTVIAYTYIKHEVISEIKKRIEKEIPQKLDAAVGGFLTEHNLPITLKNHVLAQIVPEGLRIRVFNQPLEVQEVPLPKIAFKPPRVAGSGDTEFNGHGPRVTIRANVSQTGIDATLTFSMSAKETKPDWTQARGQQTKQFFQVPPNQLMVDVLGAHAWTFLENEELDGHDPITFRTLIGDLTVFGDRRGNDVGVYTGLSFEPEKMIHVVTVNWQ